MNRKNFLLRILQALALPLMGAGWMFKGRFWKSEKHPPEKHFALGSDEVCFEVRIGKRRLAGGFAAFRVMMSDSKSVQAIESLVFEDGNDFEGKQSRRRALDQVFTSIAHSLRKKAFPLDTMRFKICKEGELKGALIFDGYPGDDQT